MLPKNLKVSTGNTFSFFSQHHMQDTSSVSKGGNTIKLIDLFSIVKLLALEKSLFSPKNNNKVFFLV